MNSDSTTVWSGIGRQLEDRLIRRALIVAAVAALVLFFGLIYYWQHNTAAGQSLSAGYGRRSGRGADSVNGTAVLAHMFELRGFQVRTADRLSPKLRKDVDVLVWFPNDFHPPSPKQREYLERWLAGDEGRTLVYVGRDYDSAAHYWQTVQPAAPAEQAKKMAELKAQAEREHAAVRSVMPSKQYARWFTAKGDSPPRTVKQLSGPWAIGIDSTKADIQLRGRLDVPLAADAGGKDDPPPPEETELLLIGDADPLAFRVRDFAWSEGQVIVVSNGSFLLNYPLINQEHRKLAGKLIDECGGYNVVFLESGSTGIEILEKEPPQTGGLAMLRIWPLNAIIIHLTIFGIVYCLARSPIFGRPKTLPGENPADFGRHVSSLGQLLARTKNLSYAQSRLAQYQQQSRRGSGASHRK